MTVPMLQKGLAVRRVCTVTRSAVCPRPLDHCPESTTLESRPLMLAGLATEVFPPHFKIIFRNVCPNASLLHPVPQAHFYLPRIKGTISSVLYRYQVSWAMRWELALWLCGGGCLAQVTSETGPAASEGAIASDFKVSGHQLEIELPLTPRNRGNSPSAHLPLLAEARSRKDTWCDLGKQKHWHQVPGMIAEELLKLSCPRTTHWEGRNAFLPNLKAIAWSILPEVPYFFEESHFYLKSLYDFFLLLLKYEILFTYKVYPFLWAFSKISSVLCDFK